MVTFVGPPRTSALPEGMSGVYPETGSTVNGTEPLGDSNPICFEVEDWGVPFRLTPHVVPFASPVSVKVTGNSVAGATEERTEIESAYSSVTNTSVFTGSYAIPEGYWAVPRYMLLPTWV